MPTPFTDIETVKEVLKYRRRKNPIPFRKIGELLKRKDSDKPMDVRHVYRLYRKGIGKDRMRLKI